MLRNYLRDAWRHLIWEKGFSAITIFGLALGLAALRDLFPVTVDIPESVRLERPVHKSAAIF